MKTSPSRQQLRFRRANSRGFTLLELMVTLAVFMVLALAATRLANMSAGVSIGQQAQSTLNLSVRNVEAQLQIDAANAGAGYFPTYNIPGPPVGVTITPGAGCCDTLAILSFDPTILANPNAAVNTTTGTATVTPVAASTGTFNTGDVLMLVSNTVQPSGVPTLTTLPLTANGSVSGANVTLTYTKNTTPVVGGAGTWGSGNATYPNPNGDPTGVSNLYGTEVDPTGTAWPYLATAFDTTDWVLRTQRIVYSVSTTQTGCSAAAPCLIRQVNNQPAAVIANNIIGFKVGVMLYGGATTYLYPAAGSTTDPWKIRSLRISMLGTTTPNATSSFRNSYDNGPYQIEGAAFIINPRNLSMHD